MVAGTYLIFITNFYLSWRTVLTILHGEYLWTHPKRVQAIVLAKGVLKQGISG